MRQPFYLVWNPSTGYTRFKHDSRVAAENEAKRLALANRGEEFIVLAPVTASKIIEVSTEQFQYDLEDQIPF